MKPGATKQYRAPWSKGVYAVSTLVPLLLVGGVLTLWLRAGNVPVGAKALATGLTVVLLPGAFAFGIYGYELAPGELRVRRLGWTTALPLRDLLDARYDPDAVRLTFRLFGNGGLFGCTGWYWNRTLGRFRFFGADPRCTVVLRFTDRTVVVTPDPPVEFVDDLMTRLPDAPAGPDA
jgi:hypothetical protein